MYSNSLRIREVQALLYMYITATPSSYTSSINENNRYIHVP